MFSSLCIFLLVVGQSDQALHDLFEKHREHYKSIRSIEATFTQTEVNLNGDSRTDYGTIVYAAPSLVVIRYEDQNQSPYLIWAYDGEKTYKYDIVTSQIDVYDTEHAKDVSALAAAFTSDISKLLGEFDVKLEETDEISEMFAKATNNKLETTFRVTPKSVNDALFSSVKISVGPDFIPRYIMVFDALENDNIVSFAVTAIKINKLQEADFKIRVKPGTTYVRNEEYMFDVGPEGLSFPLDDEK